MNLTNLVLVYAILVQSLQDAFANDASEHDVTLSVVATHERAIESFASVIATNENKCSESPCHEDATCIVMGPDLIDCRCNGDLVGDGITACDGARGPHDASSSFSTVELERALKKRRSRNPTWKKKEKKKTAAPTDSPAPSSVTTESPSKSAKTKDGKKKMNKKKATDAPSESVSPSPSIVATASPSKSAKKKGNKKKNEKKGKMMGKMRGKKTAVPSATAVPSPVPSTSSAPSTAPSTSLAPSTSPDPSTV